MSSIKPPLPFELLYWLNSPGLTAFQFRFRKIHAFTWTKAKYLETPIHPLTPAVLKRYALRQATPLWWSCVATREAGHSDRVVRSWLARRTRNAFAESLKKRGFDTDGRRLPGSGNQADLFGTASFSVLRLAAKLPYVELIKQTDIVVSKIQEFQARGDNGQNRRGKGHAKGQNGNGQKQNLTKPRVRTVCQ
jgi:hypothetical protein